MLNRLRFYRGTIRMSGILFAVFFAVRRQWNLTGVSDACALAGICMLVVAMFRTARCLRFYDLILYGVRKFAQLWKKGGIEAGRDAGYAAFQETRRYEKNYIEAYIAAACLFACSAAVLLL